MLKTEKKKKKVNKIINIKNTLFDIDVDFVFNAKPDEVNKKYGFKDNRVRDTMGGAICTDLKRPMINLIYVQNFNIKNIRDIGVLIHEITHLTVSICEYRQIPIYDIGTELGENGSEVISYLNEYFLMEVLNKYK